MIATLQKNRHAVPFWALVVALIATLSTAAAPAHAGLFSAMSEQDEVKAGQQVTAQTEKEYGGFLPYNDPMSIRVRAIGMQFARQSTRKTIPFSYRVLNNDKVLNAFAAPGGPVFVTKKLVETTSNDAELAYVLGHETGHIENKHIVKMIAKQQKVGLFAGILGALFSKGNAGNIIGTVTNVTYTLWNQGYSREHENEADAYGVRAMSRLGYDPRAAITMLGKLGDGPDNPVSKALADHPASADRQNKVRQIIQSDDLLNVAQRAGGPRLMMRGGNSGSSAYNAAYPSSGPNSSTYSPPPTYAAPVDNGNVPASGQELDLGAPLMLADRGDSRIIMGPVNGIARWAGAGIQTNGNVTTLRRGNNSLELRRNSTVVYTNGHESEMSAAATVSNGVLYAPLGNLMEGIGGKASYDANAHRVWMSLGRSQGFVSVP